jgi:hypothetical protein
MTVNANNNPIEKVGWFYDISEADHKSATVFQFGFILLVREKHYHRILVKAG